MDSLLLQAAIYLGAGLIAVPVAHRLGLGSVLGYLLAGVAIAPLLELVGSNPENVQHFAEFGVVMMLFLVGLELQPRVLWDLRVRLFGLGGLQVAVTTAAVAAFCLVIGLDWRLAIALGLIFALSSTAIVLQTLGEKGWLRTEGGQSAFSVLLFQDIAVIPMLALMPFLALPDIAGHATEVAGHGAESTPFSHLPAWGQGLVTLGVVAAIVLGGRYLTRPAFRIIARIGQHELFLSAALFLVIGIAVLMSAVGLSPALGTFLAGVLLAESEYRHELVSDLDPFKGLLLGVFFVTVGASMEFALLGEHPGMIIGLTLALIGVKGLILLGLAFVFRMEGRARWLFTFSLAQSGEFGFVLLAFASGVDVIPPEIAGVAGLVVALSMMATPLIMIVFERWVSPRVRRSASPEREEDMIEEEAPVIIAGMGRFGQIIQRMLVMDGYKPVVLDNSAEHIDGLRKFGIQVYYGNAMRPGLLEAAGIARAKLLVVCTDNRERAVELVHHVKQRYPQVYVIARAASREHVYQLRAAGADLAIREMFGSSLDAARQSLEVLGESPDRARRKSEAFARHDEESLQQLFEVWDAETDIFDNEAYMEKARSRAFSLEELMADDVGDPDERRPAADPD
ncbi:MULTISPECIES: monovalent cation:proton antiporter-2 (CPA2) family protein [Maricaulis]|jgi:CPA2 family monovalent cation:H+ antiporter-2|uniref:monovalent cation:proton antiporter-2 (CPA2) family protein n=1 Tax=Maricaulis TaxID=74317 RepID=UPI000C63ABC6|nr:MULTISPECIES: monovalent cation:proton antiporter-2 (CPA2) family protein [Maricaulis]MAC88534.1 potassium transporter [Maricaulis sp.]